MIKTKMKLTSEEIDIFRGNQGETMRKTMETLVRYGGAYDAECLVPLDGPIHMVCSIGIPLFARFLRFWKATLQKELKPSCFYS